MTSFVGTYSKVVETFLDEFEYNLKHFIIYNLSINEAETSKEDHVWKPGVYVYWHPQRGVIKVGRHLSNSRKRALEHIRGNTGESMANLKNDKMARIILFNLRDERKAHLVAAVEIFLENELNPEIKSKRTG